MDNIIQKHVDRFENPYVRLWLSKVERVDIEWINVENATISWQGDYFSDVFPKAEPSDEYRFILNSDVCIADQASRFQPHDTNGPLSIIADDFVWSDVACIAIPGQQWILSKFHVGMFSTSYDFIGIIVDLPRLAKLGVTTSGLMPVAQFSGPRNCGYYSVFPLFSALAWEIR